MTVFLHGDAHFASIANTLALYPYTGNPLSAMNPKRFADMLKKENIRSVNHATKTRAKIDSSLLEIGCTLTIPELIRAVNDYETQASGRDDFESSEAGKKVAQIYRFAPTLLAGYDELDVSNLTIADCLKSFASFIDPQRPDDGWVWDGEEYLFKRSSAIKPGRLSPYPKILRELRKTDKTRLVFMNASVPAPLEVVKFLNDYEDLPNKKPARKMHYFLLRTHVLNLPEVLECPTINIE